MQHDVIFAVPERPLGNKDVEFVVRCGSGGGGHKVLGTLCVSKGGIEWLTGDRKRTRYQMAWAEFAEAMRKGRVVRGPRRRTLR